MDLQASCQVFSSQNTEIRGQKSVNRSQSTGVGGEGCPIYRCFDYALPTMLPLLAQVFFFRCLHQNAAVIGAGILFPLLAPNPLRKHPTPSPTQSRS